MWNSPTCTKVIVSRRHHSPLVVCVAMLAPHDTSVAEWLERPHRAEQHEDKHYDAHPGEDHGRKQDWVYISRRASRNGSGAALRRSASALAFKA